MKLTRRTLLRGAGGAAVGLPFLEATAGRARAAEAPLRFVVFIHGQGTVLSRWKPAATGSTFELPQMIAPLAPFKSKINVWSGIDNNVRGIMKSNGHNAAGRSLLSAHEFIDGGNEGSASKGPSIDQVLAQKLAAPTAMKSLELRVGGGPGEYQMIFSAPGVIVGGLGDPRAAFTKISRVAMPGAQAPRTPTAADRLVAKRQSVLDAVNENYRRVKGELSAEDGVRLEAHMERLRELEGTLKAVPATPAGGGAGCRTVDLGLPASGFQPYEGRTENVASAAQIKNMVMGLSCDTTRVMSLQFVNYHGPTFDWLNAGLSGNWHDRVHAGGGNNLEGMAKAFQWYGQMFAELLKQMDAVNEGDGTLLDHSLVLWISEFGDGGAHNTKQLPVVLAGGLGGRLKTGRHLAFGGRPHNDLYTTILNLFGFPETKFGHPGGDFNRGPLPIT